MKAAQRHGAQYAGPAVIIVTLRPEIGGVIASLCNCWNSIALNEIEQLLDTSDDLPFCLLQKAEVR